MASILIRNKVITRHQADIAYKTQLKLPVRLKIGEVLVRLGYCTTSDIDAGLKIQRDAHRTMVKNGILEKNIEIVKLVIISFLPSL